MHTLVQMQRLTRPEFERGLGGLTEFSDCFIDLSLIIEGYSLVEMLFCGWGTARGVQTSCENLSM